MAATVSSAASGTRSPADPAELQESLSMAFLVLLESLGPTERPVFLPREAFGYEYPEIARIVGKSEANTLNHRAKSALRARRPRLDPSPGEGEELTARFLEACDRTTLPARPTKRGIIRAAVGLICQRRSEYALTPRATPSMPSRCRIVVNVLGE